MGSLVGQEGLNMEIVAYHIPGAVLEVKVAASQPCLAHCSLDTESPMQHVTILLDTCSSSLMN